MDTRGNRGDERRRLDTPARDGSSHRVHDVERSRSRSRSLRDRERELQNARNRLRTMEREVQRDRESRARTRQSSESRHRSRSRLSRNNQHARDGELRRETQRSDSPTFSSKDIAAIVNSLKSGASPQPVTQSAPSSKPADSHNLIPNFDPSKNNQRVDIWLKKVNECAYVYGWDERTTTHFALQKLQGLAKTWYESLNTILFSWQEWQEKLLNAFPCEQNYGQILEDMLRRKSRPNEPIEVYYYEKLSLLNQSEITGKRAVDCIIHGISDRTMKTSSLSLRCTSPEQLLKFLMSNKEGSHQPDRGFPKNKNWSDATGGNTSKPNVSTRPHQSLGIFCFNCKEKGHPYMQCPKPLVKCDHCHKFGHNIDKCFTKPDGKSAKKDDVKKAMCISSKTPNSKFIKRASVNGTPTEVFIDFGSEVTLLRKSLASSLGISHDHVQSTMKGFGNGLVKSLGSVTVDLEIDGVKARVLGKVVSDGLLDKPMLVGQTFTEQPHIVVYKDSSTLRFHDIGSEMPSLSPDLSEKPLQKVIVNKDLQLFGPASVNVQTDQSFSGSVLSNDRLVGKPDQQYVVCGGIYRVRDGRVNIAIIPCHTPCLLQKGLVLCRVERVDLVNRISGPQDESIHTNVADINEAEIKIGTTISDDIRARLLDLLHRYKHCFASSLQTLGCTDVTEMSIELSSQRPIVYRPYRLSHHEREKVRLMVDEMLQTGIIRESVSEYASPIILVRKKDGNLRMCIDYRMLNSVTVKERYPMPIIEDELTRLSGQAYFISLDLASGYYQVPISEQSKHLTAFVTPDGQFEFNRMPFGLANAPAVFQRMMNRILGSARFTKATAYIDDVLIFGKNPMECLDRLEEVLQLLEKARLTLNLSKCEFLKDKIDYLGYEISAAGIKPGEKKIQCVLDFPRPDNVHRVRQFLGLVSYFRKFIQGFAQVAFPLTRLLKKDIAWEWTDLLTL